MSLRLLEAVKRGFTLKSGFVFYTESDVLFWMAFLLAQSVEYLPDGLCSHGMWSNSFATKRLLITFDVLANTCENETDQIDK